MKILSGLTLGLFACLLMTPVPDAAAQNGRGREQDRSRNQVCVYQDIQYRGWEQCYNSGDELPNLQNRRDAISSIRIFGRARVIVYDGTNFEGRSAEFDSNVPDLGLRNLAGSRSWSDRIESFRVSSDNGFDVPGRGRGRPDFIDRGNNNSDPGDGICVYENTNYRGRSQCFRPGEQIRDLNRDGNLSDRISSIRFLGQGSAVLYRDIQFQGDRITINEDVPDLEDIRGRGFGNWDDQISSLMVETGRGRFRR